MRCARALLLCLPLLLAGCLSLFGSTPRPSFYVLSSLAHEDAAPGGSASSTGATIGVGPVSLPAHLDRLQIVSHAQANRVVLSDFHVWAEPLAENVSRVLAENLGILLRSERILRFPWPRSSRVDTRLRVDIRRFAAGPDGEVRLHCRWSLDSEDAGPLVSRSSSYSAPATPGDYDSVVESMSLVLEELSREIARQIDGRQGG